MHVAAHCKCQQVKSSEAWIIAEVTDEEVVRNTVFNTCIFYIMEYVFQLFHIHSL